MGLKQEEILDAIAVPDWRVKKQELKGLPTKEKLKVLADWLDELYTESSVSQREVQVLVYLNSMSRGGQIARVEQVRGKHLRELFSKKRVEIYTEET